MKILFDQGVPVPLGRALETHEVVTAYDLGWSTLSNGALLRTAVSAGFQIFVTTDQNLRFQQNLNEFRLAIVVLPTTSWPQLRQRIDEIRAAMDQVKVGSYTEL